MQHQRIAGGPAALHVVVLDAGERFPDALVELARRAGLAAAELRGIGAFSDATLGFYDLGRREYERIEVAEQVELVSLAGNLTFHGGEPKVHAHAVVAGRDGAARGGHLLAATVRPTLELVLTEVPARLQRTFRAEVGLPLIDLSAARSSPPIGRLRWAIAEGYIPDRSTGPEPEMRSHETACILNAGERDAHVELTVFYATRAPAGPYRLVVPARSTLHLRFDELEDPEPIPRGTDYASLLVSDVPIVVQHTRLDSRQSANALLSTLAFGAD